MSPFFVRLFPNLEVIPQSIGWTRHPKQNRYITGRLNRESLEDRVIAGASPRRRMPTREPLPKLVNFKEFGAFDGLAFPALTHFSRYVQLLSPWSHLRRTSRTRPEICLSSGPSSRLALSPSLRRLRVQRSSANAAEVAASP
jgi:hypothetical protein